MSMDAPAPVLEPEKPAEAAPDAVVAAPACPAVEEAPNREICLRHDRNQAKKRCTCGKARRYRPGRGYQPPTENKALVQLVADGVEPVCASMRRENVVSSWTADVAKIAQVPWDFNSRVQILAAN